MNSKEKSTSGFFFPLEMLIFDARGQSRTHQCLRLSTKVIGFLDVQIS